jgi:predicted DNA-binding protein (MmcQ/YjbR family)
MDVEWVRKLCRSFAHTTEQIQWGSDLVFKVGGKMYAVMPLEPAPVWLSFKCTDEEFATLTEQAGVIPAPYMARAKWVSLESQDALGPAAVKRLLRMSYDLVLAKLPQKTRSLLDGSGGEAGKGRKISQAPGSGPVRRRRTS